MTLSRPNDQEKAAAHGLPSGLAGLRALMDRLLADDGCAWDRAQTLDTLRPYLLEEAHEVLEAMDDPQAHRSELGDLLFQIVFHSALRERQGYFDLDDVIAAIVAKMIRRHPHVFARGPDDEPQTAAEVERRWAELKAAERAAERGGERAGEGPAPLDPLAGVPRTLPALARAWRLQDKAATVGFDWPDVDGAMAKLREEWDELEQARTHGGIDEIREELGDVLFVLVRIGHKLGVEAEDALRRANAKFERRFAGVMRRCEAAGVDPTRAGLDYLDARWQEVKAAERAAATKQ